MLIANNAFGLAVFEALALHMRFGLEDILYAILRDNATNEAPNNERTKGVRIKRNKNEWAKITVLDFKNDKRGAVKKMPTRR